MVEELELYIDPCREWTEKEERLLTMLLSFAGAKILSTRYPYGDHSLDELPERYRVLQIRIAAELFAKHGAFGQTRHEENGIVRIWESSDVAQSLLSEVIPMAGGVS